MISVHSFHRFKSIVFVRCFTAYDNQKSWYLNWIGVVIRLVAAPETRKFKHMHKLKLLILNYLLRNWLDFCIDPGE